MAYSSILGAETAPAQPSGRDSSLLGPSDNTDSGSDTIGTSEAMADSDAAGTGERASVTPGEFDEGADIEPDRIVRMDAGDGSGNGFPEADPDGMEMTDLDADTDIDEADAAADGQESQR